MFFRRFYYFATHNKFNVLLRKMVYFLLSFIVKISYFINKIEVFIKLGIWLSKLNGRLNVYGFGRVINIGRNVTFYDNTNIEIGPDGVLTIGENFTMSYGSIIACSICVRIDDNVMIGEFVSIRDSSHNYKDLSLPINQQGDYFSDIYIGSNVWIGRGSIVFPGTRINSNVVVGANSIVKGLLDEGFVYAGNPLKKIKKISDQG